MNDYMNTAQYYDLLFKPKENEVAFYKAYIKSNMSILDIGCGTGVIALSLLRCTRKCSFTCIDNSSNMLEQFNENYNRDKRLYDLSKDKEIKIVKIDMRDYIPDELFDLIIFPGESIQAISIEEIPGILIRYTQYLKPKGYLILTTFNPIFENNVVEIEKIAGLIVKDKEVILAVHERINITGKKYEYKLHIKHFGKDLFMINNKTDVFCISIIDDDEIKKLENICDLKKESIYSNYKKMKYDKKSNSAILVYRNCT